MIESLMNSHGETERNQSDFASRRIDPDRRIDVQNKSKDINSHSRKIDPDRRIEVKQDHVKTEISDNKKIESFSTPEERIDVAENSKGKWEGDVGNSLFIPDSKEARKALEQYGQNGIEYKDGNPDFSKTSEATVEIDNMTSNRPKNFRQADIKCAEEWNKEGRDGRTDWKPGDVTKWRRENKYSWHERLDRKTMDLVQSDIHGECKHWGGVAECKRAENKSNTGGGFDE